MWSGYAWSQAAWASLPQNGPPSPTPDVAGLVYGGDGTRFRAFGGDESSGHGIVSGGDQATGVVFGGDGRAG